MNKRLSIQLSVGVIIIVALIVGGSFYFINKDNGENKKEEIKNFKWSFNGGELKDDNYAFTAKLPSELFIRDRRNEISNKEDFERIFLISNYKEKFNIENSPDDLILFEFIINKKEKCEERFEEDVESWKKEIDKLKVQNICEDEKCYIIPSLNSLIVGSYCYSLDGSVSIPDSPNLELMNKKLEIVKNFGKSLQFLK